MINVLLVDDHQMFIDGVSSFLSQEKKINIVGIANDGKKAMELLQKEEVDVIVLDIRMPHMDGIEVSKAMKKQFPNTKILILSMFNDRDYIVNLILKIGINGYILKNKSKKELVGAIHNVHRGNAHFSIEVLNKLAESPRSFDAPIAELTKRELEIVCLIKEGKTSSKIAEHLNIKESTVNTHRRNIREKLDVHTIGELLQLVDQYGWCKT